MDAIIIWVNKKRDEYHFVTPPEVRQLIKKMSPNFRPAYGISVRYDTGSNYEVDYGIYTALLGVDNQSELIGKVSEIRFVDTHTEELLHSHTITA